MNNVSKYSNKYKKYAFRKIGKFFGSCAVATVITLSGVAIMTPNVTVYASDTTADGEPDTDGLSDSNAGYEVIIPKGKQYIRNDKVESHEPVLKEKGYNGRSFILPKEGEEGYFFDHPMSELFTKLYDKDNDGNVDDEYKNPEPVDNSHAGETIDGGTVPYRSEINPKYPHVVDSGLTGDSLNAPGVWKYNPDGKYAPSDGVINDQDTIVVARKPITVDENANDNVVKEDGSVVLSYPYRIHVNKGDHIDKKDDVYEVGTKPKVVETPIPFTTRYEKDDESPKGKETEVTPGVNGKTVTTTTYEVDPNTGKVTENPSTSETTDPVVRVVKIGAQPKVEETPIPFTTRYEKDDESPKGKETEVTPGVNGKTVTTTTYEVDPNTGKVTENPSTSETTDPVVRVVKRGTQPKVEKTPIPFETRYEDDNSIPEGEEREVTAGVNGKTVKTTTYELNPTTGEVTANEPTSETTNPITRVVKRGTQPKPGETPETPQPKPGETPGKPTQPEQPSGTEDQPDLKVAPPTIAIIEEPNKASFEVKAPKKDADTVKITYPKSDGSGNEVLTLTKQPSGEWTLDKKPENVTLDKTTGTVTIPRESVVNKQKVQAQSKHKTSGYTPFVFAALSIEEANPEHPVTLWVDTADKEIKEKVIGKKVQAGEIAGYKWLSSRLEEGILTHKFKKVTNETSSIPNQPESVTNNTNKPSNSTPEKSSEIKKSLIRTVWKTQDGKELKSPSTDKQEAGEFEGYEFVESHLEGDNVTVHVFRAKKTATNTPNEKTTQPEERQVAVATVTSDKKEEETLSSPTSEKVELPNTGTVTNGFFTVEVAAILAGLGILIPGVKKKETEE